MKIYFASSIRGDSPNRDLINSIIQVIELKNMVINKEAYQFKKLPDENIYARDIKWIKESDLVIAEVTNASLGVGYEISYAEQLNKKIICIYQKTTNLSAMINGNPNLIKIPYDIIINVDKKVFNDLEKNINSFSFQ